MTRWAILNSSAEGYGYAGGMPGACRSRWDESGRSQIDAAINRSGEVGGRYSTPEDGFKLDDEVWPG